MAHTMPRRRAVPLAEALAASLVQVQLTMPVIAEAIAHRLVMRVLPAAEAGITLRAAEEAGTTLPAVVAVVASTAVAVVADMPVAAADIAKQRVCC